MTLRAESESADWDPDGDCLQDIASEIALDIGLRQRLLQTVESRIEWALILRQALVDDASDALTNDALQTVDFKAVALDAMSAIDAPIEILFAREEPAPPLETRRLFRKKPTVRANMPKKTTRFLYIRLEGSATPCILRCPVCLRTDFSTLQGLFNHARGSHSLGWTSHDECVRQCSCTLEEVQGGPVDFADLDAGVEVGAGTGGMLPGLRSLFQRAVGAADELELEGETALSRSLGFHAETPALATFLGKEPIRRGVMVWDPDAAVDVDGIDDEQARTTPRWRMPFSHRNIFRDTLPPTSAPAPPETLQPRPPSNTTAPAHSRFHILTRIVVVDRSLWLPPEQRAGPDTHKWMISVDAPSYTRHITTVLERLAVESPTGPLVTTAPPFAVLGTAQAPFLARLELSFCASRAGGTPQKVVLEHWVELDRMQSRGVVYGEEQMVDVELDRGTVFLPQRSGYIPSNSRALWDLGLQKTRHAPLELASRPPFQDVGSASTKRTRNALPKVKIFGGWENVLKHLVDRFPLTLQDVKGGKPPVPALPYKLVANPAQFSALVMGRKKAVEWGRATAMRDAYNDAVVAGLTEDVTTLTTADVFSWLSSNGYFPWGAATIKQEQDMQMLKTGSCGVCGLAYRVHALAGEGPVDYEAVLASLGRGFVCKIIPADWQMRRMPMIDISRLLPRRSQSTPPSSFPHRTPASAQAYSPSVHDGTWDSRAPALLAVVDPALVAAVRTLVSALKLSSFARPPPAASPIARLLPPPAEVHAAVAPHAMLALLTRQFVRALVKTALEASARDRHRAMGQLDARARGRHPDVAALFGGRERRMLTLTHVVRGVAARGWDWNDALGMAIMGCLARIGVPLEQPPFVKSDEQKVSVKMEVE